jgi:hypothetical protein
LDFTRPTSSSRPKRHVEWLSDLANLGVDELYLHQVAQGPDQERFIEVFAESVLPELGQ